MSPLRQAPAPIDGLYEVCAVWFDVLQVPLIDLSAFLYGMYGGTGKEHRWGRTEGFGKSVYHIHVGGNRDLSV